MVITPVLQVEPFRAPGRDEGAKLKAGGELLNRDTPGFYLSPALFTEVSNDMRIAREEIFGPVLAIFKWSDEARMIDQVNAVEYGLTCSIWTNDLVTAHRVADQALVGLESIVLIRDFVERELEARLV